MSRFIRSSWKKTDKKALDSKLTQQIFSTGSIMLVRYVYEPDLISRNISILRNR